MKDRRDAALEMAAAAFMAIESVEDNIIHLDSKGAAEDNAQKAMDLLREAHKLLVEAYTYVR